MSLLFLPVFASVQAQHPFASLGPVICECKSCHTQVTHGGWFCSRLFNEPPADQVWLVRSNCPRRYSRDKIIRTNIYIQNTLQLLCVFFVWIQVPKSDLHHLFSRISFRNISIAYFNTHIASRSSSSHWWSFVYCSFSKKIASDFPNRHWTHHLSTTFQHLLSAQLYFITCYSWTAIDHWSSLVSSRTPSNSRFRCVFRSDLFSFHRVRFFCFSFFLIVSVVRTFTNFFIITCRAIGARHSS